MRITKEEIEKINKEIHKPYIQIIAEHIKRFNDCKVIAEIGVHYGEMGYAFIKAIPDVKYYGYDGWETIRVLDEEMARKLFKTIPNAKLSKISFLDMKEIASADLIHINGNHNAKCCTHDLDLAFKYLNPKGVVLVNVMTSDAVNKVVSEWYDVNKDRYNMHIIKLDYHWAVIWRKE